MEEKEDLLRVNKYERRVGKTKKKNHWIKKIKVWVLSAWGKHIFQNAHNVNGGSRALGVLKKC